MCVHPYQYNKLLFVVCLQNETFLLRLGTEANKKGKLDCLVENETYGHIMLYYNEQFCYIVCWKLK